MSEQSNELTPARHIQLLPGLSIQFAPDGTWLHFDGTTHKCGLSLENILYDHPVVGRAIKEWNEEKRKNIEMWR